MGAHANAGATGAVPSPVPWPTRAEATRAQMAHVFNFLGVEHHDVQDTGSKNAREYAPMRPETRARLLQFYAPHNRALERMLGRELPWARPA